MEKTKREKNSIIIVSTFSIIVFLFLSIFGYSYLYSNISEIEGQKTSLNMLLDDYNKLKKQGFSLEEIKSSLSGDYTKETLKAFLGEKINVDMIKKIPDGFFNKNFINTGSTDYKSFLDEKLKSLQKDDLKTDFIKTQEQVFAVLPIYSDKTDFYTNQSITDFSFISNIENILRKFGLKTNSEIGISNLVFINNSKINEKQSLEEGIYYIPLNLDLTGSKANILNFLDYVQTSGAIKYVDGNLEILNNNQISDISSINMKTYIDSSTVNEDAPGLIELKDMIKNSSQATEKYEISVNLRFYVIGIPSYKIKTEVEKVIGKTSKETYNYFILKSKVVSFLAKSKSFGESNYRVKQLKNINSYLNEITKDITSLSASLNKGENLEKVFESSQKYKNIFDTINKNLADIQKDLNIK